MSAVVVDPPGMDVEYPEGPQVPEGDLQTRRRMELLVALRHWLANQPGGDRAWVCCDINVYYRQGDPRVVVAPDIAVAFGVNVAAVDGQSTYRVWEAGAAPAFVLEIASPKTVAVDLHEKPAKYAELGVHEYWRLDPTGGELLDPPLQGERRHEGRWEPIEVVAGIGGELRGHSEVLGLDLCWQPPKLRLYDPAAGTWLLDPDDLLEAQQVAETRADAETAARKAAEAELAALRQRLGKAPPPGEEDE